MSGHSKWAQIKHQKATTDQKKGRVFSKLIRQIAVAARADGSDPASNFKLRLAIERARDAGMPKDNIERAIQKSGGESEAGHLEQITYEGFGPFGTAFVVEAATDNKNRTTANIRHILEEHGGSLGQPGSVIWSFETKGQLLIGKEEQKPEDLELAAIDAGAEDVRIVAEGLEIYTAPLDLNRVKQALEKLNAQIVSSEIIMEAKTPIELVSEQKAKVRKLLNELSDHEGVIAVHTSANL